MSVAHLAEFRSPFVSYLECGDLSPLCLSKTAFLSIVAGIQKGIRLNFR